MNDRTEDSVDDPWGDWAERESARLRRESELGWDAACERMADEANAEAAAVAAETEAGWNEWAQRTADEINGAAGD